SDDFSMTCGGSAVAPWSRRSTKFRNGDERMNDEFDFSREAELLGSGELEYGNEMYEFEFEHDHEHDHDHETELAAELLTISGEAELDHFLGGLFGTVKNILNTPAGQKLKGLLKGAAKKGLKLGGQAVGSYFGG